MSKLGELFSTKGGELPSQEKPRRSLMHERMGRSHAGRHRPFWERLNCGNSRKSVASGLGRGEGEIKAEHRGFIGHETLLCDTVTVGTFFKSHGTDNAKNEPKHE